MTTVCITGMHRSGTSLLARIANLLGVHLGGEDHHLAANPANPTGYWEHRGIVRVNNEVLARLGGDWAGPPHLPPGWEHDPDLEPLRCDARRELEQLQPAAPVVGFKDPRACLTLPFWQQLTEIDHVVACVRPPLAVARSLERRNGLAEGHVAALYSRYVSTLIAQAPALVVVDYHALMGGSRPFVANLAEQLGLPAPSDQTMQSIAGFVRPDLDRAGSSAPNGAGSPELHFAREVHARIADLPDSRPWFEAVAGTLNEAAASDGRAPGGVGARVTRLAAVTAELETERRSRAELQARQVDLDRELTDLRREQARLRRAHERLRTRRSVRVALAVAALARPLVRSLRAVRWALRSRRG